jgi:hypothetical protein
MRFDAAKLCRDRRSRSRECIADDAIRLASRHRSIELPSENGSVGEDGRLALLSENGGLAIPLENGKLAGVDSGESRRLQSLCSSEILEKSLEIEVPSRRRILQVCSSSESDELLSIGSKPSSPSENQDVVPVAAKSKQLVSLADRGMVRFTFILLLFNSFSYRALFFTGFRFILLAFRHFLPFLCVTM